MGRVGKNAGCDNTGARTVPMLVAEAEHAVVSLKVLVPVTTSNVNPTYGCRTYILNP
jgi:hypothetical protein